MEICLFLYFNWPRLWFRVQALLLHLPRRGGADRTDRGRNDSSLAVVAPVRGRLFLFPHACPHEGRLVAAAPKLFLRGEIAVSRTDAGS